MRVLGEVGSTPGHTGPRSLPSRPANQPTRLPASRVSVSHDARRSSTRTHSKLSAAEALRQTQAEASERLQQLQRENKALREELAKLQNVSPEKVEVAYEQNAVRPAPEVIAEVATPREERQSLSVEELEAGIIWPAEDELCAWERAPRSEPLQGPSSTGGNVAKDARTFHVVHVSAEFAPVAKVGGLGDVVTGLARACQARGHDVEVILPFYQFLREEDIEGLQHVLDFDVPKGTQFDGQMHMGSLPTSLFSGRIDGIPVLLVRPDWGHTNIFQGGRVYAGSYNETEAYLYFSRASLELLKVTRRKPDIIHAHEWQTAAVPMLFWEKYYHNGLDSARLVFTIHNLDSPGECRQDEFAVTGIPGQVFADVNKALDERTIGHNPERLCLMKGGIVYSNAVTTVSPTYASEAVDGGAAGWLKSTLARPDIRAKFKGILNGIDMGLWNPMVDNTLPAPFDHNMLEGKALCKRYLQRALRMEESSDKPLVAVITRLVPQKGIHLIKHSVYRTEQLGGQFVLLGSGHADGDFRGMAEHDFKGHPNVRLMIMYSDSLAHLIYAAADIILVPSLFEPCGLTQLVGMRYGAIPVVRKTGGLADTVKDVDEGGNGFTFDGVDNGAVDWAITRAMEKYRSDKQWWSQLVMNNMHNDYSWDNSAGEYVELYKQLVPW